MLTHKPVIPKYLDPHAETMYYAYYLKSKLPETHPTVCLVTSEPRAEVVTYTADFYQVLVLGSFAAVERAERACAVEHRGVTIVAALEGLNIVRKKKRAKPRPHTRRKRTPEERAKTSRTMTGTRRGSDNPFFARKHTEETKKKIRASQRRARQAVLWYHDENGKTYRFAEGEEIPAGLIKGRGYIPWTEENFRLARIARDRTRGKPRRKIEEED